MATILVTGAAGFIGSHTCDRLVADGHRVLGVDDLSSGHRENLSGVVQSPNFRFHQADVAEEGCLAALVAEFAPDAILHLAGLVSVARSFAEPELNERLNFTATRLVAEAAAAHGVKRVVFASTAAVYGIEPPRPTRETAPLQPASPYGEAKLRSEKLLLTAAGPGRFQACCVRYFNVYGPRQDPASPYSGVISVFADRLRRGAELTIHGDGQQSRDFVSVFDVARANTLALTHPLSESAILNVCTGRGATLLELIAALEQAWGTRARVTHAATRQGDARQSLGAPDEAKRVLSFEARTPLAAGLREIAKLH